MKVHKVKVSQWFGGERRSSLCGRLNARSADGMNVTDDDCEVTCRFCLRNMEITQRLRAAKAGRAALERG